MQCFLGFAYSMRNKKSRESRKAVKQGKQKAERQRSKAEKQRSREAERQRSREAKKQKSTKAEKQRSKEEEKQENAGKQKSRKPQETAGNRRKPQENPGKPRKTQENAGNQEKRRKKHEMNSPPKQTKEGSRGFRSDPVSLVNPGNPKYSTSAEHGSSAAANCIKIRCIYSILFNLQNP